MSACVRLVQPRSRPPWWTSASRTASSPSGQPAKERLGKSFPFILNWKLIFEYHDIFYAGFHKIFKFKEINILPQIVLKIDIMCWRFNYCNYFVQGPHLPLARNHRGRRRTIPASARWPSGGRRSGSVRRKSSFTPSPEKKIFTEMFSKWNSSEMCR